MSWTWIPVAYLSYLTVIGVVTAAPRRARVAAAAQAALWWGLAVLLRDRPLSAAADSVLALAVLVTGYWTSGLFFRRPMVALEQALLRTDRRCFEALGLDGLLRHGPRAALEYFELSYLLVYLMVPAGAVVLGAGGLSDELPRFWRVVLVSAFLCYGALPWLQTRPPRAIEAHGLPDRGLLVRRLNLAVHARLSIRVNTLPSGHSAAALAVALVVLPLAPLPGAVLLGLALSIAAATVIGRYHYAVDSIVGLLVGVLSWAVLG